MAKPPRKAASPLRKDQPEAAPQVTQEPGTFTDVLRRMQKETQAASEAEAQELTERVEAILMRSLEVQASTNKAAKRQNLKELKAMRDELKATQGMGDTQKEYEALFDKLVKQSVETSGIAAKVATDLQSNILGKIPTIAGLVNLAGSNNPMIGMGLKLLSSASRNITEAKRNASAERAKRLDNLKSESLAISEKLKQAKKSGLEPANDPKVGVDRGDGRDENGKFIKETNSLTLKQLDVLIGIYERLGGAKDELEKSVAEQKVATRLAAKARSEAEVDRLQGLENAKESKSKLIPAANDSALGPDKEGGMLKHIAGEAIGNMVGKYIPLILAGLVPTMVSLGVLLGKGGKLLKLAGKVTGVIAVAMAVFDFFKGFTNAAEILGKADVGIVDKVAAGLINLVSSLIGLVDDVLGFFGVNTDFAGTAKAAMVDFYNQYSGKVISFVTELATNLTDWVVDTAGSIGKFFDEKTAQVKSLWDAVSNFDVSEFMVSVKEGFKKKVEDMFTFVKDSIEDLLVSGIGSLVDVLPEFARTEGMNEILKRKNDIQTRKQAEKDPGFVKGYEKTADEIKDEKAKREAAATAATAAVLQQNNTSVSNNTTIGQPKISVGNPDQSASQGLMTFGQ